MPLRETVYPENVEPKVMQPDMQRQRIQGTTPGDRMKKKWKEHWCKCGCGICCRASDPGADDRIKEWKAKHKCGRKNGKAKQ